MASKGEESRADLFEHDLATGAEVVVGADEAGRGCLAGPIVAASVRFDRPTLESRGDGSLEGLFDSKRLTERRREVLFPAILSVAGSVAIVARSASFIDSNGIQEANLDALATALADTGTTGSVVRLVDGFDLGLRAPAHDRLIKGDSLSAAVAAASVVAKVTRDRMMKAAALEFPGYGFEGHKGYGSATHREAIERLGPCPLHRRSFRLTADGG